jgi:hypothetical protein
MAARPQPARETMQHSTYVLASRPAALDDFAGRVVEPAKLVLGVQLAEEADGTIIGQPTPPRRTHQE